MQQHERVKTFPQFYCLFPRCYYVIVKVPWENEVRKIVHNVHL